MIIKCLACALNAVPAKSFINIISLFIKDFLIVITWLLVVCGTGIYAIIMVLSGEALHHANMSM